MSKGVRQLIVAIFVLAIQAAAELRSPSSSSCSERGCVYGDWKIVIDCPQGLSCGHATEAYYRNVVAFDCENLSWCNKTWKTKACLVDGSEAHRSCLNGKLRRFCRKQPSYTSWPLAICSRTYIECGRRGKVALRRCEKGDSFNAEAGRCTTERYCVELNICPMRGNGAYSTTVCTSEYYVCYNERAFKRHCASLSELFDQRRGHCVSADEFEGRCWRRGRQRATVLPESKRRHQSHYRSAEITARNEVCSPLGNTCGASTKCCTPLQCSSTDGTGACCGRPGYNEGAFVCTSETAGSCCSGQCSPLKASCCQAPSSIGDVCKGTNTCCSPLQCNVTSGSGTCCGGGAYVGFVCTPENATSLCCSGQCSAHYSGCCGLTPSRISDPCSGSNTCCFPLECSNAESPGTCCGGPGYNSQTIVGFECTSDSDAEKCCSYACSYSAKACCGVGVSSNVGDACSRSTRTCCDPLQCNTTSSTCYHAPKMA